MIFNSKSNAVIVLVTVVLSFPAIAQSKVSSPEKLIKYGDHYLDVGQVERALSFYKRVLPITKRKAYVHFRIGMVYNKMDKPEQAFKELNTAIKLDPKLFKAYKWRGDTYADVYKYGLAIKDYERAITLASPPSKVGILKKRATAYDALNKEDRAVKDMDMALSIFKNFYKSKKMSEKDLEELSELYELRGMLNYNRKNYTAAVKDFSERLKVGNYSDQVFLLRAECYKKMGKLVLSLKDYSKIIEVNPKDESAYQKRGDIYLEQKKYVNAINDYTLAIKNYPGNPARLYRLRAKAYKEKGDQKHASADLEKSKKADENFRLF